MCATHPRDLIHIPVQFHYDILNGYRVTVNGVLLFIRIFLQNYIPLTLSGDKKEWMAIKSEYKRYL